MARRKTKSRKVRPVIFVFCEGETEEQFVHYLRSKYKCPIEIRTKVSHTKVLKRGYISRNTEGRLNQVNDRVFLLYDLDREGLYEGLSKLKRADLISSNPCFELWLLLHYEDCNGQKSSEQCITLLKRHIPDYEKGKKKVFDSRGAELSGRYSDAKERAKSKSIPDNPSTDVYRLVDLIRELSKDQER